ncbi:MAG: chitobiase/beta-hexosaminidase C-terminal domain-containing protein, partial [Lentimicrobiaceae bacterium]|nr:chitobiase/beta-hexosaminidase C-terminal domain-containing protein [Lentimicrobiaceae bacterium]
MKKLFYLGLTALLMFFAFGSANAQTSPTLTFSPESGTALEFAGGEEKISIDCTSGCEEIGDKYVLYRTYATRQEAEADDIWDGSGQMYGDDEAIDDLETASSAFDSAVITKEKPVIRARVMDGELNDNAGGWVGESFYAEYTVKAAEAETTPAKVTITNSWRYNWNAASSTKPNFKVAIADGDVQLGEDEGDIAIKATFTNGDKNGTQIITAEETPIDLTILRQKAGKWAVAFQLVKGNDNATPVEETVAVVDEASMSEITVVGQATISLSPMQWTMGSQDKPKVTVDLENAGGLELAENEEGKAAVKIVFTPFTDDGGGDLLALDADGASPVTVFITKSGETELETEDFQEGNWLIGISLVKSNAREDAFSTDDTYTTNSINNLFVVKPAAVEPETPAKTVLVTLDQSVWTEGSANPKFTVDLTNADGLTLGANGAAVKVEFFEDNLGFDDEPGFPGVDDDFDGPGFPGGEDDLDGPGFPGGEDDLDGPGFPGGEDDLDAPVAAKTIFLSTTETPFDPSTDLTAGKSYTLQYTLVDGTTHEDFDQSDEYSIDPASSMFFAIAAEEEPGAPEVTVKFTPTELTVGGTQDLTITVTVTPADAITLGDKKGDVAVRVSMTDNAEVWPQEYEWDLTEATKTVPAVGFTEPGVYTVSYELLTWVDDELGGLKTAKYEGDAKINVTGSTGVFIVNNPSAAPELPADDEDAPLLVLDPDNSQSVLEGTKVEITCADPDFTMITFCTSASYEDYEDDHIMKAYSQTNQPVITAEKPLLVVQVAKGEYVGEAFYGEEYHTYFRYYTIKDGSDVTMPIIYTEFAAAMDLGIYPKGDNIKLDAGGITMEDNGNSLWYTTDGSEPSADNASTVKVDQGYTTIKADQSMTIKAIGVTATGETSDVAMLKVTLCEDVEASISLNRAIALVDSVVGNNAPITVAFENDWGLDMDYTVYYTLDGTTEPSAENYGENENIMKIESAYDETYGDLIRPSFMISGQAPKTIKAKAYMKIYEGEGNTVVTETISQTIGRIQSGLEDPKFSHAAGDIHVGDTLRITNPNPYDGDDDNFDPWSRIPVPQIYFSLNGVLPAYNRVPSEGVFRTDDGMYQDEALIIFQKDAKGLYAYIPAVAMYQLDTLRLEENQELSIQAICYNVIEYGEGMMGPGWLEYGSEFVKVNYTVKSESDGPNPPVPADTVKAPTFNPAAGEVEK